MATAAPWISSQPCWRRLSPSAGGGALGGSASIPDPRLRLRLRLRPLTVQRREGGGGGGEGDELVRTLLIDNYDSYTYNVFQELSVVNRVPPVVIYNDEWSWEYIHHCLYDNKSFDNIVISPGPGSPTCPTDIGVCLHILRECGDIPILGVCLGHQALGFVHGAKIIHAPEPIHGRLSEIQHTGCDLFNHIPSGKNSGFKVVRYHSLVIEPDSLPDELVPIAWATSDRTTSFLQTINCASNLGFSSNNSNNNNNNNNSNTNNSNKVLMGVMHSSRPHYGVQFHPESIATSYGRQIFENFRKMTIDFGLRTKFLQERKVSDINGNYNLLSKYGSLNAKISVQNDLCKPTKDEIKYLKLKWKKIEGLANKAGGSGNIFREIFGDNNAKDTFWLDSSSTDHNRARFSFMGGKGGPLWKQITFRLIDQKCKTGGHLLIRDVNGSVTTRFLKDGFFDFLNKEIESFKYDEKDFEGLPFGFYGGFVGYLGYGLKVECGASSNKHKSKSPDACLFFSDNLIAIDHLNNDIYLLSLQHVNNNHTTTNPNQNQWISETEKKLIRLAAQQPKTPNGKSTAVKSKSKPKPKPTSLNLQNSSFTPEKSKTQYLNSVKKCLDLIREGESYELCLTNQIKKTPKKEINLLKLYLKLRERNPAPYAAWLNFEEERVAVCCSSPERFLKLDGLGLLEAKPIKGTVSRGNTLHEDQRLKLQLQYSEKDQAENLMIVDLLRNDLGRVCQPGTVHVPSLMEIQSYSTVHTLVSTITGRKQPHITPVECVKSAFPGGSMTGAPKLRSMELLDSIESGARGVYSGSIGFVGFDGGFDLNIVIRTVVWCDGEVSVGAGGAVVGMSGEEEEWEEMRLKARVPLMVVEETEMEMEEEEEEEEMERFVEAKS